MLIQDIRLVFLFWKSILYRHVLNIAVICQIRSDLIYEGCDDISFFFLYPVLWWYLQQNVSIALHCIATFPAGISDWEKHECQVNNVDISSFNTIYEPRNRSRSMILAIDNPRVDPYNQYAILARSANWIWLCIQDHPVHSTSFFIAIKVQTFSHDVQRFDQCVLIHLFSFN